MVSRGQTGSKLCKSTGELWLYGDRRLRGLFDLVPRLLVTPTSLTTTESHLTLIYSFERQGYSWVALNIITNWCHMHFQPSWYIFFWKPIWETGAHLTKKKRVTWRSLCSSLTYTDDLVVIYSSSSGICPWGIQFRPFSCHLANPPIGDVSSRLWHLVVGAKLAAPDSNRYPVRLLFLLAATHADKQHHRRHHHPSSSKPLLTSYQFKVKVGFFFWSLVY